MKDFEQLTNEEIRASIGKPPPALASDVHKITIRPRKPGEVMHGQNIELLMDDKPLNGVTGIDFRARVGEICEITLTMIGEFDLQGELQMKKIYEDKNRIRELEEENKSLHASWNTAANEVDRLKHEVTILSRRQGDART